uniref:Uncharacterized protein n=1 Tax=Anguilla anguilla TaxID=7936 RepID=A0A0E9TNW3_ANGAN
MLYLQVKKLALQEVCSCCNFICDLQVFFFLCKHILTKL